MAFSASLQKCFGAGRSLAGNMFNAANVSTKSYRISSLTCVTCQLQSLCSLLRTCLVMQMSCTVHSYSAALTNELSRANDNSDSFFV
jgi:hypothetical protein